MAERLENEHFGAGLFPLDRRTFLFGAAGAALRGAAGAPANAEEAPVTLAMVPRPSPLSPPGDPRNAALNDGNPPASSRDNRRGSYGNWPRTDLQWVQYDWSRPITTD